MKKILCASATHNYTVVERNTVTFWNNRISLQQEKNRDWSQRLIIDGSLGIDWHRLKNNQKHTTGLQYKVHKSDIGKKIIFACRRYV